MKQHVSPVVVTLSRRAIWRTGLGVAVVALMALPATAFLGSGGAAGSPTLVDQQLEGIVAAGNLAPTIDPGAVDPAALPLRSTAVGPGLNPVPTLQVLGPGGAISPIASSAFLPGSSTGIPRSVLAAYHHAADVLAASDPGCGLPWWLLAGIGRIESGHAAGGHVDGAGTTIGRILGPRLDGSTPGTGIVLDTDHGSLDGDPLFDRAVGPMQFLPSTWMLVASDGNGDGRMDPNNVYDAALGAARYLCGGGAQLTTEAGLTAAVMRYNHSAAYVADVLSWGRAYRDGVMPLADAAGPIPTAQPATTPAGSRSAARPPSGVPAATRHTGPGVTSHPTPTSPTGGAPNPTTTTGTSGSPTPSSGCTPTTGPTTTASPSTASSTSAPPTDTASTPPTTPTAPPTSSPTSSPSQSPAC